MAGLFAVAAAALMGAAGGVSGYIPSRGLDPFRNGAPTSATCGSSKNGGRRSSYAAQKRASRKARNVARFKRSARGNR